MLLCRLFFLACLISAHLSLSQESGKANPRVPVTKPPEVASKGGTVYVVGDVHSPMGVGMGDTGPTAVLKVLAMAEGVNPTASLHKAKIIRKGENGPTEVPIDIKEISAGKAPDLTLQAGDILFVPRSVSKSAHKPQNEDFYDVPPSDPLHRPTPIYIR
jgi:polysaccharide biosynthesis/export protein